MKEEKVNKEEQAFLDNLVKEQPATRALQKLNRQPLEVSVYRHTSTVQALEQELTQIGEALANLTKTTSNSEEELKTRLQNREKSVKEELEKHERDKVEGLLTTLTYRDINDIKAAVTEAIVHFREYNFEPEIVMARIVAEERFMTVFCALKRKNNSAIKYFASLDEIAMVDDLTIFDLYKKWEDHFVLTEDELKNS